MKLLVDSISFSYPKRPVLNDASLRLNAGEVMSLVGPNGSGKSTLVKCVDALLAPSRGAIFVNGVNTLRLERRDLARLIGYVPQTTRLLYSVSVFDAVLMGRRPYQSWHCSDSDMDIAFSALESMGLVDLALRGFNELSGGQQQRVLIARALAQTPELLLLDEPTSALDIAHQLETMETVRRLAAREGIAVLMVMHDLTLAVRYSDSIALMRDGRVIVQGRPDEVVTRENLARAYGIESAILREGKYLRNDRDRGWEDLVAVIPLRRWAPEMS